MLAILLNNPKSIIIGIRDRFKHLRLSIGYTQEALATRSDVSLGSLKRFERTGEISLVNLVRLSSVLGCMKDLNKIAIEQEKELSFDEMMAPSQKKTKKRGVLKS
jgi:transcriptional regulator with XRE-family HTH domain